MKMLCYSVTLVYVGREVQVIIHAESAERAERGINFFYPKARIGSIREIW